MPTSMGRPFEKNNRDCLMPPQKKVRLEKEEQPYNFKKNGYTDLE